MRHTGPHSPVASKGDVRSRWLQGEQPDLGRTYALGDGSQSKRISRATSKKLVQQNLPNLLKH